LTEVADEALRAARVLAHSKNIDVRDSRPRRDLELEGDEGLLRQLLLILLDNAVKYTPSGGRVELKLQDQQGGYGVEVSDSGEGIAQADLPFVFDRFYRADKARSRRDPGVGSGAGLGLAIAKWIAELHGGAISVLSSPARHHVPGLAATVP
jgi:signal transduction histidine kinase